MQTNDLFKSAKQFAVEQGEISIIRLQRHLRCGYAKAGRILDELIEAGIVEQSEKPTLYSQIGIKNVIMSILWRSRYRG